LLILRLLSVIISHKVWSDLYACLRKIKKESHETFYFTNLPRSPPWMDCHQIWHVG